MNHGNPLSIQKVNKHVKVTFSNEKKNANGTDHRVRKNKVTLQNCRDREHARGEVKKEKRAHSAGQKKAEVPNANIRHHLGID